MRGIRVGYPSPRMREDPARAFLCPRSELAGRVLDRLEGQRGHDVRCGRVAGRSSRWQAVASPGEEARVFRASHGWARPTMLPRVASGAACPLGLESFLATGSARRAPGCG